MTVELLSRVGVALWGQQWTGPMAKALEIDNHTLRRMASGQQTIPDGVWGDLIDDMQDRIKLLQVLSREATFSGNPL